MKIVLPNVLHIHMYACLLQLEMLQKHVCIVQPPYGKILLFIEILISQKFFKIIVKIYTWGRVFFYRVYPENHMLPKPWKGKPFFRIFLGIWEVTTLLLVVAAFWSPPYSLCHISKVVLSILFLAFLFFLLLFLFPLPFPLPLLLPLLLVLVLIGLWWSG